MSWRGAGRLRGRREHWLRGHHRLPRRLPAAGADIGMMAKFSYMDAYKGDHHPQLGAPQDLPASR